MTPELRNLIATAPRDAKGRARILPAHAIPLDATGQPIPAFIKLMKERRWVGWIKKPRSDGSFSKPPISLKTMKMEGWNKLDALCAYETAVVAAQLHNARGASPRIEGLGFLPSSYLGLCFGDIDHAFKAGKLEPWARAIIRDGDAPPETYCERSPSGEGLRFIGIGSDCINNPTNNIEMYRDETRYMTITGANFPNAPDDIRPAPRMISAMLARAGTAVDQEVDEDADCLGEVPPKKEVKAAANDDDVPVADLRSETPMAMVNSAALAALDKWVPKVFGDSARKSSKDTWRVSSEKLGRDTQEDLSIDRKGVKDFGLHDQGDARKGKRTPVDLLLFEEYQCVLAEDYQGVTDPKEAALLLCDLMGRPDLKALFTAFKPFKPLGADDPAAMLTTPEWPAGTLPRDLEAHMSRIAERMRAAPGAAAFAFMATMAACIPPGVRVDVLRDGTFLQRANVYALLVGRPGAAKSPLLGAAKGPLLVCESEWRVERKKMQTEAARNTMLMKRRNAAAVADEAASDPAFEAATDDNPTPMTSEATQKEDRMRVVNDATAEKMVRLSAQYGDGLILAPGELDLLMGNMDRYSSGRSGGASKDANMLIVAHDGDAYRVDRVTSETVEADALVFSIVTSTQPSALGAHLGDPRVGSGLFQRFLFCPMGRPAERRSAEPLDPAMSERHNRAVRLLLDVTRDHGKLMLRFSPEAVAVWRHVDDWAVREGNGVKLATEEGMIAKTGMHVARLALALEMIEWAWQAAGGEGSLKPPAEVSAASVQRAFDLWQGFLLPGARQCLRLGATARVDADAKALADMIERLPDNDRSKPVTDGQVRKNVRSLRDQTALERAAGVLIEIGMLAPATTSRKGGQAWAVNPMVWAA